RALTQREMSGCFGRGCRSHGLIKQVLNDVALIGEQSKDLAEIRAAGPSKLQAVLLRPRKRFLVRIDFPFTESLQPAAHHEAATVVCFAFALELLVVNVNRRV